MLTLFFQKRDERRSAKRQAEQVEEGTHTVPEALEYGDEGVDSKDDKFVPVSVAD